MIIHTFTLIDCLYAIEKRMKDFTAVHEQQWVEIQTPKYSAPPNTNMR